MSQENVEIVAMRLRPSTGATWMHGREYWTDDIDYRAAEGAPDDHGPIQGKDALRAYMQDWLDTFDDFRPSPSR